jgi:hypothetical protein
MLESLFFYTISTAYQRWFPENRKDWFNTDLENWFWNVWKIQIFETVKKKFGRNVRSDNLFFIFSEHQDRKERRHGRDLVTLWKKWKSLYPTVLYPTVPYCTLSMPYK